MLTWPGGRRCLRSAAASISSCLAVTLQLSLTRLQICFQLSVTPALGRGSLCLSSHPRPHPPLTLCCLFYLLCVYIHSLRTVHVFPAPIWSLGGSTSRAGDTCATTAALLPWKPQSETVDNQRLQPHSTVNPSFTATHVHVTFVSLCVFMCPIGLQLHYKSFTIKDCRALTHVDTRTHIPTLGVD